MVPLSRIDGMDTPAPPGVLAGTGPTKITPFARIVANHLFWFGSKTEAGFRSLEDAPLIPTPRIGTLSRRRSRAHGIWLGF
jgi:hypothetical protein